MNKILMVLPAICLLSACATQTPPLEAMDRDAVIRATQECESAGMRTVVSYTMRKHGAERVKTPVSVNCEPVYRRNP